MWYIKFVVLQTRGFNENKNKTLEFFRYENNDLFYERLKQLKLILFE